MTIEEIEKQIDDVLVYFGPERFKSIPQSVVRSVALQIALTYMDGDQYEYSDNFRLADVENPTEVAEYIKARSHGCCGSHDEVFWCCTDEGKAKGYLIGFNYGH